MTGPPNTTSAERISQLSAELFMEIESQKKTLREEQERMNEDAVRERHTMQREFEERFAMLQHEQQALRAEKERMQQIPARENDVMNLNVWFIFVRGRLVCPRGWVLMAGLLHLWVDYTRRGRGIY